MFEKGNRANTLHGILLIALFSFAAFYIAEIPFVKSLSFSPLIVGIILGMLYANSLRNKLPETWVPGIKFCTKQILRAGIVLYGFRLTLTQVAAVGLPAVIIDTIIVAGTIFLGIWLGKLLKMDKDTSLMTSTGSAICGAAAVMGLAGSIKVPEDKQDEKDNDVTMAVAIVAIMGTVFALLEIALGPLTGMTKEQLIEAFKRLKKLGAKRFGIHSFLASNTVTNEYYPTLAGILFELAVEVQKETGVEIAFVNLSGGVGIPYTPDKEPNDIAVIGEGVRQKFEEIMVPAGLGDVAIFTELGRFMLAPYGALIAKAIHEKHIYKEYIGLDACAVNLMRPAMYGAYHHITVLGKEDAPCDHKYDVTGSLCENNDKFAVDRMLPKIDMGDYLFIHDAGAHGFAMGYNYNGKLKSAELLLQEDGSVKMIRRAETPKDYFATFDFCDILKNVKE